jgi:short-subunit dehydrogenase
MKKNILITWGSKWIGNFLIKNLKEENNILWISRWEIDEKWVEEFNIDLTKTELINNFVKKCDQNDKQFDCLIINAGIWYFGKYEDGSDEEYKNIINLNLLSPILFIKALKKHIAKDAKIIFIWSIIGKKFLRYGAVYQASKFWLRWFAWALKNEMKWRKIHIINPRIVDTTFHDEANINIEYYNTQYTSLESILDTVNDILEWRERKFEIDL